MSLPSLFKATSAANLRVVSVRVKGTDTVVANDGVVKPVTTASIVFPIATLPAKAVVTAVGTRAAAATTGTIAISIGATSVRANAVVADGGASVVALTGLDSPLAAPQDVTLTVGTTIVTGDDFTVDIQYYIADAADVVL